MNVPDPATCAQFVQLSNTAPLHQVTDILMLEMAVVLLKTNKIKNDTKINVFNQPAASCP